MNGKAVEVLVGAAMRGEKQAFGAFRVGDAICAYEALRRAPRPRYAHTGTFFALSKERCACPECGIVQYNEQSLIFHLNDNHQCDFLTIARKLGPDA